MRSRYTRRLGKTEYFYWLYNKIECTNFILATALKGKGSGICIEPHLEKTLKSFSRLQESVSIRNNRLPAFTQNKVYKTTVTYRFGNERLYSELLKKELTETFEQNQAPMRALVFYLAPEDKLLLAVTFNHVFNDARGALTIFKFLLSCIYCANTNGGDSVLCQTPTQESLLPGSVKGMSLIKHTLFSNKGTKNNISAKDYSQISPSSQREFNIFMKLLGRENTANILQYCKSNMVSVTSFLAAIQCSLVRDLIPSKGVIPIVINIPFDNRDNILPADKRRIPGLYITIPRLIIKIGDNYMLKDIARKIDQQLKSLKESDKRYLTFQLFPARLFPPSLRGISLLKKSLGKKPVSSMLTNIGKIEMKTSKGELIPVPNIDFHVAPSRDCAVCTSAVSFNGQLNLSVGINTSVTGKERSIDIYERYISRLLLLPGQGSSAPT